MALIEVQHVVADMYAVDSTTNPGIIEGRVVALNADSEAVLCDTSSRPIGLAGDSSDTSTGQTEYAADLVLSPNGATRSTSNRVSDFFNESLGSGKITVYNSGGRFLTDQYNTSDSFTPGDALFSDANGRLTTVDTGSQVQVAVCIAPPRDYPSGVPGTDIDGSITLGSFMPVILSI